MLYLVFDCKFLLPDKIGAERELQQRTAEVTPQFRYSSIGASTVRVIESFMNLNSLLLTIRIWTICNIDYREFTTYEIFTIVAYSITFNCEEAWRQIWKTTSISENALWLEETFSRDVTCHSTSSSRRPQQKEIIRWETWVVIQGPLKEKLIRLQEFLCLQLIMA